ncbi:hypothetical protein DICSQDRAFT_65206 [Dichomitus squalens LYAD-421 SS1]|uniref:DNA 3'-5' helicase n=1 Tax=Dichomitus squalens (strain LYAD-421) TaxID=732165 RepID=R7SWN2_DICSQ|nr:uncharacterized protein DICSQDRAFT_65206 [Dichomitus squalens LYAD-421 SS1]EJF59392.1 hypothetical protein DICSQDRAFT_65206 [Dichomitus squalens LYAD-421 SS1]
MSQFLEGDIDILLATEAAGMGCNIPDIARVVQFKAPDSLSTWLQRAGRAGRNVSIQARAVLLIQPSVFQEVGRSTHKDGDTIVYKKTIEPGLRRWVEVPIEQC